MGDAHEMIVLRNVQKNQSQAREACFLNSLLAEFIPWLELIIGRKKNENYTVRIACRTNRN